MPDEDFETARDRMVRMHLAARGITNDVVLEAMSEVPREAFVPEAMREFAYEDSALPLEEGQTISQPYVVARMLALAAPEPGDTALEVGAGSGYAAAVLSRICSKVYAIERRKVLADNAAQTISDIGFDNVEIIHGDGTKGLADRAPFDVVILSAGGREIPEALREQLAIGGRLVIPVARNSHQILTIMRRTGEETFEYEEHDPVMFVPLVSDAAEPAEAAASELGRSLLPPAVPRAGRRRRGGVSGLIGASAEPFDDLEHFARLAERFADRRVVLLGEATHGTAEFYEARARITERLVERHGFNIIAVEADWPDAGAYRRYVRGEPRREDAKDVFKRFPRWMWRNQETYDFLKRLKAVNETKSPEEKAGFYGLDVYSMCASIEAVIAYLDRVDTRAAEAARRRYACLTPWCKEPAEYGRMAMTGAFRECEERVAKVLVDMLRRRVDYIALDGEAVFDAEQNARIVANAEEYYRAIYNGGAESWNLRDEHMFDTLERLLERRGPHAKAVVWAHNSHIGDASATEMSWRRGERNLGQLARRRFGDDAALIGFGTDRGTVAAASGWGGAMEIKKVRPARDDAFEGHCRETRRPAFLLDLSPDRSLEMLEALDEPMLERAIGVVYRPQTEIASHYFEARPSRQFDAWAWLEETTALLADTHEAEPGARDTFPFGV